MSNDDVNKPDVNADHNSNAVGSISAGGDISGNIHIGNVYQTPEDDLPLSSDEIENGLTRFAQYLPARAPVLQDSFSSIAKKLRATLGADQKLAQPRIEVPARRWRQSHEVDVHGSDRHILPRYVPRAKSTAL